MRRMVRVVAGLAALSCVASACSDDSGDERKTVRVGVLWEVAGESAVAVNYFQYGVESAVKAINAAGGIAGRKIELTRVSADPFDPQKAIASYLKLLDTEPTAIMGYTAAGPVQVVQRNLRRDGIPFLGTASVGHELAYGKPDVAGNYWTILPSNESVAAAGTDYVSGKMGLTKIGLMGTNESFGKVSVEASKARLRRYGREPVAVRQYAPKASDLTEQVLAMKGSQAILNWGYPNPVSVQLKQSLQNGPAVPTFYHSGAQAIVNNKLAPPEALRNLHAVLACEAKTAPQGSPLASYAAKYQQTYKEAPTSAGIQAHDAVYILKKAIEKAGSTENDAVNKALGEVTVGPGDGVLCARQYKADKTHFFTHALQVVKYAGDGSSKLLGTVETNESEFR